MGDNGVRYGFNRYINETQSDFSEQFILLSSQEIKQDLNLKSVEFGYSSSGTVSIMVSFFMLKK